MEIALGGLNLEVASDKAGAPQLSVGSRASQPGDGRLTFAEWRVDGHDLNGFEQIPPGGTQGYLGRAYGVNTDGRDLGLDHLGPAIQVLALSEFDLGTGNGSLGPSGAGGLNGSFGLGPPEQVGDSTGSSNGADQIIKNNVPYEYIIRGSRPAKVDLRTMTPVNAGLVLSAPATDILATVPTSATVGAEISIAIGASRPYVSLQRANVGDSPALDTWANNSAAQGADVFGLPPDQTMLVTGNTVRGNIQTGTVTMTSPNWATLFQLPLGVTGTGFALDGNLWVIGTSEGPQVVDANTGDPFPLIPELSNDSEHCRGMANWFALGVVIPLRRSLRFLKSGGGRSFGPETFLPNTTPVTGQPTAIAASERELFTVEFNPTTGDAYLVAWYERRPGDQHAGVASPYVLARFTGKQSRWLRWLGTVNGVRTNDTLMGGYGPDAFFVTCGRTQRWIDDGCFPGDTRLSMESLPVSVSARRYTGELTEITTSLGHKLSGTPNHPILTDRGWVKLSALKEGDHVAHDSGLLQRETLGDPDIEHVQPTLRELFDLASIRSPGYRARSVAKNFHGDGQEGEVDVVPINGELRDWLKARLYQPLTHDHFIRGDVPTANALYATRSSRKRLDREMTPAGIPRGSQSANLLLTRLSSHSQCHALGEASYDDPVPSQVTVDGVGVDTGLPGDPRRGFAGNIAFDDVVSVRRFPFSGHVYNLETESHRYGANGIVAHNSYQMALSGTTYGTETRRDLDTLKDCEFVEFDATGTLDANKTITVALEIDGVVITMTAVTTAGVTRLYCATAGVPAAAYQGFHRIAPRWTIASNSATAGPMVRGPFRVYYRLRPTTVRQWTVNVLLKENERDTPAGHEAALRAMINAGSKQFEDLDRNDLYVKVMSVSDVQFIAAGSSEDNGDGTQRYVTLELEEWTAAA